MNPPGIPVRTKILMVAVVTGLAVGSHVAALTLAAGWVGGVAAFFACYCAFVGADTIRMIRSHSALEDLSAGYDEQIGKLVKLGASLGALKAGELWEHLQRTGALQIDVNGEGVATINSDGEPKIHILFHGLALCGQPGIPAEWPNGDRWVSVDDKEKSTCQGCQTSVPAGSA